MSAVRDGTAVRVGIVIPAYQEERSVGSIVERSLKACRGLSCRVIVADNASTDRTAAAARAAGAEVTSVGQRGYGAACLGAIRALGRWPDVYVFLDADGSSRPEEIPRLLGPIAGGVADLVLGVRPSDSPMTRPQKWGTRLAVALTNLAWGCRFKDMGPFRAVSRAAWERLRMRDRTWGWTIEMQIQAVSSRIRWCEVPVSWEPRMAGRSKISGTVSGVVRAGTRILWTIVRYRFGGKG